MRVVIHVGAHKTGTSLVQWYFNDDPPQIRSLGISFIDRPAASELVGWGNKPPEIFRTRLEEERARQPSIVLTSIENGLGRPFLADRPGLYPDAVRGAEGLAKATAGFDTHVIYYVRPMVDFLESFYLQTIHQGAWHTFEEWYDSLTGPHSWMPAVQALDDAFGADRVHLGDFTEMRAGQNRFLELFMTRAGLPPPPTVEYETVRNPSISARGLDIARGINPHLRDARERRVTRLFLQKHFSNQVEDRARPMPEDLRRTVSEQAAAEFEALAARAAAALTSPLAPPPVRPLVEPRVTPPPANTPRRKKKPLKKRVKRLARRMRARVRPPR